MDDPAAIGTITEGSADPGAAPLGPERTAWLAGAVRDVADFPRPGVTFRDLTPLLADAERFHVLVDALGAAVDGSGGVDTVVGIEARGFILGAAVAYRLGAGFTPIRKAGKLPAAVLGEAYTLEYGDDRLEIHADAVAGGDQVLVVDDVLATGGTAAASVRLLEQLGARVLGLAFALELAPLDGRSRLEGRTVTSVIRYG